MTPEDFRDRVYPSIKSRWPFIRWDHDTMAACALDIGPIEPELAVQIVLALAREGYKTPPTGGQIYAKAKAMLRDRAGGSETPAPRPAKAKPPEPEDLSGRWQRGVDRMQEAMKIVLDHEKRGVPCDPRAYPGALAADVSAAMLRRDYDHAIERGRFIGFDPGATPKDYAAMLIVRAKDQHRKGVPAHWMTDPDVYDAVADIIRQEKESDGSLPGSGEPVASMAG